MPPQSRRPYLPRVQVLVCLGIVYNILYFKKKYILPPIIHIPLLKASRANIQHVWKSTKCGSSCLEWPAGTLLCWSIYRKHMPMRRQFQSALRVLQLWSYFPRIGHWGAVESMWFTVLWGRSFTYWLKSIFPAERTTPWCSLLVRELCLLLLLRLPSEPDLCLQYF